MPTLRRFAPAKINLYLHLTGRREDGYHYLDSLAAFTAIGDELYLDPAPDGGLTLVTEGPMANALADGNASAADNLVLKAARLLAEATGRAPEARFRLVKNLPVASGIGGGSTDAAAALGLLAEHWGMDPRDPLLSRLAAQLGQDVPCCLDATTCWFTGIGDRTEPGPRLPHTPCVLVNPRAPLSTPLAYKMFRDSGAPFDPPAPFDEEPDSVEELAALLRSRTNSFTSIAQTLVPAIGIVLQALEATDACLLARMSGSGATCFGLYPDRGAARSAAAVLFDAHPDWWVVPTWIPA